MKIGIIGLGYAGLRLAAAFADAGHEVVGVDSDSRSVEAIVAGRRVADVEDAQLAHSPERIDPGRTDRTIRTTSRIVGGVTETCRERAVALYAEKPLVVGFRGVARGIGAPNLVRL